MNEVDVKQEQAKQLEGYMSAGSTKRIYAMPQFGGSLSLLAAMQRVMAAVGYAQKQGTNEFHGYKYVTEADAIAALRPAMVKEGLLMIPSTQKAWIDEQGNTHVLVRYNLIHAATRESLSFDVPGSGNDRAKSGAIGDKGVYKALTGASKYALLKTFLMETGEDPEVMSAHDKDVGKHTAEEETALKNFLAHAQVLIDAAGKATLDTVLNDTWRAHHASI